MDSPEQPDVPRPVRRDVDGWTSAIRCSDGQSSQQTQDVGSMLAHRLRGWPNIKPALDQRLVFVHTYSASWEILSCHYKYVLKIDNFRETVPTKKYRLTTKFVHFYIFPCENNKHTSSPRETFHTFSVSM